MARPLRIEYPGAVYHVMSRGHERSKIFRDDRDRRRFLQLLGDVCGQERWELHGYCLLTNHYHLLVETPEGRLSTGMSSLNSRYAQWFNWRHDRHGHLLEGRFRAVLVQKESHLLELHRYIVLNPVRAKLARRAADWKWSSYRATAGVEAPPSWLAVDWTLSQFARGRAAARQGFARFVAEGKVLGAEREKFEGGPYLGDAGFRERIESLISGKKITDEIPLRYRHAAKIPVSEIRRLVAKEWKVSENSLARRRGGDDKKAAVYLVRRLTHLPVREIGELFGVKPPRVSNIVSEVERERASARGKRIERLQQTLESRRSNAPKPVGRA